jgi:hypothetical protein
MAAALEISSIFEITGLYSGNEALINKFTHATTPAEVVKGCPVTGTTATSLDLGDIAAGSGFSLYLEALVGNFYIKLGATSGTPVATDSHLYIKVGESYVIPINPNATAMPGIRFVGDSATAKLLYCLVGS